MGAVSANGPKSGVGEEQDVLVVYIERALGGAAGDRDCASILSSVNVHVHAYTRGRHEEGQAIYAPRLRSSVLLMRPCEAMVD